MISQLGEAESRALLRNKTTGRLGCSLRDKPYVVPVNYIFEDDCLYVHSLPGRKINFLSANPNACLQIDEVEDSYNWRSVIAFGHYEEVVDADERERILTRLFQRLPHLSPVESRSKSDGVQTIVFRLRITEITGVFEKW
jgi:nitroimidazol reductase NimA-like FMN-containing flavoprotein (pyridoxamine 5'-phosphate oxidase superfamily)